MRERAVHWLGISNWRCDASSESPLFAPLTSCVGLTSQSSFAIGRGEICHVCPPCLLVAVSMQILMVSPTKRHGEFVADLAAEISWSRELEVVGVSRALFADETRLCSDEGEMDLAALPCRFSRWID